MNENNEKLLKVLSGPNAGAEVLLGNGSCLVGNAVQCDVVLRDEYVAATHLKIKLINGQAELEVLAEPLRVNGENVQIGQSRIGHQDVITVGLSSFAVGDAQKDWSNMVLPPVYELEKPRDKSELLALYEEQVEQTEESSADIDSDVIQADQSADNEKVAKPIKSTSKFYPGLTIPAALMMLAAMLGQPDAVSTDHSQANFGTRLELQNAIGSSGSSSHLNLKGTSDGMFIVEGYVSDYLEAQMIKKHVASIDPDVTVRIHDSEKLVSLVSQVLAQEGLNGVRVSAGDPGVVVLSGYVQKEHQVVTVIAAIRQQVESLRKINSQIVTVDASIDFLNQKIEQQGIESQIVLSAKDYQVVAKGRLDEKRLEDWKIVTKEFRELYESLPELVDEIRAESITDS